MEDTGMRDIIALLDLEKDLIISALRVLGTTGREFEKIVAFLTAILSKEKQLGKTNIKQILEKVVNQGGDIMFFQFDENRVKEFQNMAKKFGLLYSVAEDKNKNDGMMEIIFHSSHSSQVERVMKELGVGRVISEEEYINNASDKKKSNKDKSSTDIKKKETELNQDLNTTAIKHNKFQNEGVSKDNPKLIKDKLKEFEKAGQVKFKENVMKRTKDTVKKMKPKGK